MNSTARVTPPCEEKYDRPFSTVGMDFWEKESVATNVSGITGDDMAMFDCFHEDGGNLLDMFGEEIPDTSACCFRVEIKIDSIAYIDERKGDIRLSIADELQRRADALQDVINVLREHYAESVRRGYVRPHTCPEQA